VRRDNAVMGHRLDDASAPARLAAPDEGIGRDELALATRNHGLPLEALRYDVTPPGLHYVLTHYDIPYVPDDTEWQLTVGGLVRRPLRLTPADLRAFPQVTTRVTLECAGNGRALLTPRPVSQPWLVEAVGTADWTGVPLRLVLEQAGVEQGAVDVVFTGADHGVERGVEQDYQRSLTVADASEPDVLLAYAMNGEPLLPDHGFPARLVVPDWVGIASIKWLGEIEVSTTGLHSPWDTTYYVMNGEPLTELVPKSVLELAWNAGLRAGELHRLHGRAWSGSDKIISVEVSVDDGRSWRQAELTDDGPWVRWQIDWRPGADQRGPHTILSRATDAAGRRQPDRTPLNPRGYLFGAVVRHPVVII